MSWPRRVTTCTEYCANWPLGPTTDWLTYTVATPGIPIVAGWVPIGWPLRVPTREEPERPCSLATQWVSTSDNVIRPPRSVALDTFAEASVRPVLTSIAHCA